MPNANPLHRTLATLTGIALLLVASVAFAQRPTLEEALAANPNLATVQDLIVTSGYIASLDDLGRYTFFAPTDAAMASLSEDEFAYLRRDRGALDVLFRHHMIQGAVPPDALARMDAVTTVEWTRLALKVRNGTLHVGGVPIRSEPVRIDRGYLYVIDQVLQPQGATDVKDLLGLPVVD